jgi:hypothetical protein
MKTQPQEAGTASGSLLLVAPEGLAQMVRRQRTAVTVADSLGQGGIVGHFLTGGQMGGCGLPFELNLARALDDVSYE